MKLEQSFEVDAPLERVWEALIDVVTDFTLTGRLARFGRGGMNQDVSNRLLRDFAGCLQSSIEPDRPESPPAKPAGGLSLFFGALLDRLRRLFRG
jgi:carbon monoxide dehydrogenase subunit G